MGLLALCATGWALPALNPLLERNHRLKRDLEACGGTLTAKSGEITTPYYPLQYPRSTQCTWIIRATKLVNITFVDFELESGMNCTFDFMKFDDLSEIPVYIPKSKYCGTVAPNTWNNHDKRTAQKSALQQWRIWPDPAFGTHVSKEEKNCPFDGFIASAALIPTLLLRLM
ncbi:hypothetical protein NDU88_001182 [Pleurodeles waltl]|uniref:CUB domain-containing protein n=1 Tax=Pleurodeles waltl TaxID=8319 RepID=A0AAV7M2D6_PLEWA|nr:hypothetical protein NDU88_001182 [Pleurodeles waltl]